MNDLTVVLPAYNEEESLGRVIDEIMALPVKCDILVVDNNSTDDTYNIATYKGVKVVTEPNRGKGNAVRKAFSLVNTSYVIMMDSDYTYPAKNILAIKDLLDKGFDVAIGYRYWTEDGSMPLINSLGNRILSLLASMLYRQKVEDVCSGLWGFRKDTLDKFHLRSGGFTLEAELFTKVVKHKCKLGQIPINYRARLNGSKPKLKIRDGFKIGWFLLKNKWK